MRIRVPLCCLLLSLMLALACAEEDSSSDAGAAPADDDESPGGENPDDDVVDDDEVSPDPVDAFWGAAPDEETRLKVFDRIWSLLEDNYACFANQRQTLDWYSVRDQYRPQIQAAESYGRFFERLNAMIGELHDSHTYLVSMRVCYDADAEARPPVYNYNYFTAPYGACVTPTQEDELLVYRTEDGNPAGLRPGDVVLGYDGKAWSDLLIELDQRRLPVCGAFGSAAETERLRRLGTVLDNAHLFQTLDVRRFDTGAVEHIPTDGLLDYYSYLICNDQLPVDGVEFPYRYWDDQPADEFYGYGHVKYGKLAGTNIGYIYVYQWYYGAGEEYSAAVQALMDTDGLIIDQRYNLGGVPHASDGNSYLFNEDVEFVMRFVPRDPFGDSIYDLLLDPGTGDIVSIDADEATFYDRPIAVLTGPHALSGGDIYPAMMEFHPRARSFGRLTNGGFGGQAPYWTEPDPILNDLLFGYTAVVGVDANDEPLQAWAHEPDVAVWLEADDVVDGVDTVVQAALSWIAEENGK